MQVNPYEPPKLPRDQPKKADGELQAAICVVLVNIACIGGAFFYVLFFLHQLSGGKLIPIFTGPIITPAWANLLFACLLLIAHGRIVEGIVENSSAKRQKDLKRGIR